MIGAAVPFAMLAAPPVAGAAEAEPVAAVSSEQLPPAPAPTLPDPQALLDLQQCLTDVQAALPAETPPAPAPGEAEQLPPAPAPAPPDLNALNELCQQILTTLQGAPAPVPAEDPVDLP